MKPRTTQLYLTVKRTKRHVSLHHCNSKTFSDQSLKKPRMLVRLLLDGKFHWFQILHISWRSLFPYRAFPTPLCFPTPCQVKGSVQDFVELNQARRKLQSLIWQRLLYFQSYPDQELTQNAALHVLVTSRMITNCCSPMSQSWRNVHVLAMRSVPAKGPKLTLSHKKKIPFHSTGWFLGNNKIPIMGDSCNID